MQRKEAKLPDDYPLFDVDDISLAFSTADGHVDSGGRYLNDYEGQTRLVPDEYQRRAFTLFFEGGGLDAIGLKPRDGFDKMRIHRALRYLLTSWAPKHEEKMATVGFALMKWCEPIEDAADPEGEA